MSSIAQHTVSVPATPSAVQVAAISVLHGKIGALTLHATVLADTKFDGKPKSVEPIIFSFQESSDGGANWTTLGSPVTATGEKAITLLPSKNLIRINARGSNGKSSYARLDLHYVGRFGRGQLDFRAWGGKEGFSYSGDPSSDPTAAQLGLGAGTPAGSWPSNQGSQA